MMKLIMLIHLSVYIIFWMHTVGTAHGNTVWPPWITLSGCFNYSSNNATSNFEKNEPTKCFERCQGNQSVGLKNMSCICNPIYTSSDTRLNIYCNVSCPGKPGIYCGREGAGNELMSVYTRDAPLPDGINKSTNYGYGYVVISGGYKIFHTSDANTSLQIDKLCYDEFEPPGQSQCKPDKSTLSTWEGAIQACNHGSARLINASDVSKCGTGIPFIGTYWIWLYREKPDTTTSTATTLTATTTTSTSSTSSKPTPSFKTTTDSRSNHTSDNPVIEQTSKASSSDGINVVAVAASVAVIVVIIFVVLTSILICKKRKLLCFKIRHKSDVTPGIAEILSSRIPVSIPPGSTRDPFQSPYQYGRPITARVRDIESGQSDQTILNSNNFTTNMSDNIQNPIPSDIKGGKKRKDKQEKQAVENDKHSAIVDRECGEIETNSKTNIESLDRLTNGNLSDVNERTGHPNGEDKDNTRKRTKKKRKRTREDSYTDDKVNSSSAEPGSDFVSGHHSKRTITLASPDRVQVTEKQPYQPNDKVSDGRRKKMEQDEMLSEKKIKTLAQKYDELVFAPAETLVIEKQKDLYIERLGRKDKKKRRKENEMVDEDGVEQDDLNLNEVYKEPNNGSIDTQKEKKKKRKKSRERSKEKVLNGYDELVDAPAANLVVEERNDLQNESSNKKHKKRKKKKDKTRGDDNVA